MSNKVLALLVVVAVAGVALGSLWLLDSGGCGCFGSQRDAVVLATSVAPGETVMVTIVARDYGPSARSWRPCLRGLPRQKAARP